RPEGDQHQQDDRQADDKRIVALEAIQKRASGGAEAEGGVGRSTIRRILRAAGLPPVPQPPTSWQTFLNAHWGVIAGADFFTTEVWTWQGLVATRSSSLTWPPAGCKSSARRHIQKRCSCSRSSGR